MATMWSQSHGLGSAPTLGIHIAVETLEKELYDEYLCLVASNKQQINW